jgi:hypothetical protein
MAILHRVLTPQDLPTTAAPVTHMRRCTFRRVSAVPRRGELPLYDVSCLYPKRDTAIPLGDLASARPICAGCSAPGIFRPDED